VSTAAVTGQCNGIQVGGNNAVGASTTVLGDTVTITRNVTQAAGQTSTLGGATTNFIGISATTASTNLIVGSTTAGDANIIQVRDGTSGVGTVTYQAGTINMIQMGSSGATTASPASQSIASGNKINTGSTTSTTTGASIRGTGTFSGLFHQNAGAINYILDNTIVIDRVSASGTANGINQSTAPSELADSVKNNSITFTGLAGTTAVNGLVMGGGTNTTPKTINSNTVTVTGTNSGTFTGFSENWSGGQVVNNTFTASTASATMNGITFTGASGVAAWTAEYNTISLTSSAVAPTAMNGILGSINFPMTINNNTFTALNMTGIITSSPVVNGISITSGTGGVVRDNTVNNMSIGAATSTGSPVLSGISVSGGSLTNVFKNRIYGLMTEATGASTLVNGIVLSGGTTNNVFNNLIGDLTSPASTNPDGIRGLSVTSTGAATTHNVHYNTVYLNTSSTGVNFGSTGVFHTASTTSTTATLNLRNNIIYNTSTAAGTGLVAAYRRSNGALDFLANYGSASNQNDFYGGTPSATNVIYTDGTSTAQTMPAYKAGVFTAGTIAPRDAASFSDGFAPGTFFQSLSGASANFLKYNTAIALQVESGGANIGGYTDDYIGTIRQGNGGYAGTGTAPDVGAWELEGIPADLTAPTISYSLLGNTSCLLDRDLTPVTATDASGVNTAPGTRPRLYYKKATNANVFNDNTNATDGWKFVEATGAGGSPFSFTTNYSLLNGGAPVVGDVIQYFVVAEDLAPTPNVGINVGTFTGTPASVALGAGNFPIGGTLNSYNVIAPGLSGTVNVGAAETYTSLTEATATGLFQAINTGGISAAVTVNIMDATITETGAVALNAVNYNGCAPGPYTITIKPNTTSTLTGSVANGTLIKLNGASSVTIDGSNSGGSDRSLTITNTNATSPAAIWIASVGGAGTSNNTVKNCNISTGSNSLTSYGIAISDAASIAVGGANNDNVTIQNNAITRAYIGVFANGTAATSAGGLDGLSITQNIIGPSTSGVDNIGFRGITVSNAVNPSITSNTVQFISGSAANVAGIATASVTGATISMNTVQDLTTSIPIMYGILAGSTSGTLTVDQNVVRRFTSAAGSTNYVVGIEATNTATIDRNQVSDIENGGTGTYGSYGINLNGGNGSVVKNNFVDNIRHNMSPSVQHSVYLVSG
jgi:hypothetical protein